MSEERLKYLFERYLAKDCTGQEREELFGLSLEPGMDDALKRLVYEAWHTTGEQDGLPDAAVKAVVEHILRKPEKDRPGKITRLAVIRRWAVAASIILAVGWGSYWLLLRRSSAPGSETPVAAMSHDVEAPQSNRATVTLSNGQKIFLDSAGNGQLAQLGHVQLVKLANGQIAYQVADGGSSPLSLGGEAAYNTLTNPRGSKVIDMKLSDGSHVWLNAGSSITYPVAFTGSERKVTMTGEAYFEVAHKVTESGAKQYFIVEKGDMQITVLGTHFNVNAYDDESNVRVTLLEGSVKVSRATESVMITPGQQAQLKNHGNHSITKIMVQTADLEQVMAWKNGYFIFDNTDIRSLMRQVSRWYDVDVVYEGPVSADQFMGGTPRQENISALLKVLEGTGTVHFNIEGRKIIVTK